MWLQRGAKRHALLNLIIGINKAKRIPGRKYIKIEINIEYVVLGGETLAELVTRKIIISGNVIESYEYEKGYLKGYVLDEEQRKNKGRKKDFKSEEYSVNRGKVLQRAMTRIRRVINANVGEYFDCRGNRIYSKFFTMTFAENVQDLKYANGEFKKFIKRLNYQVMGEKKLVLKYTAVVEFQKRGAIHYHIVFYNMPFVKADRLQKIWGHGCIKINAIDKVDNVGAYITKYMTKDNEDGRLQGEKCYFNSRELKEPQIIEDKEIAEKVATSLPLVNLVYSSEFENEYVGTIKYHQFNSKRRNDASMENYTLGNIGKKSGSGYECLPTFYCKECGERVYPKYLEKYDKPYFQCLSCNEKFGEQQVSRRRVAL